MSHCHHSHHDKHAHHDHEHHGHHHHHHGNFKEIFLKSLPLGIIIMILSPMMGIQFFWQFTFHYSDILVAILATILFIYGGKPFYQGGIHEIKAGEPGMMALVGLGISVSYLYSLYAVFSRYILNVYVMDFFFELASLILIMLLGHWIEMKAVGKAGNAQESLAKLLPKNALVIGQSGETQNIPVSDLKIGDLVRVQSGESIPADGIIKAGQSRINEALLTGESKPIKKEVGDPVIGGSTNTDGTLDIEVSQVGNDSFLSQVQHLITQAQSQTSKAEDMAAQVAGYLFYIALAAAIIALLFWTYAESLPIAITFVVTTLVISCPHALGLAIPLVVARSTSLGAERGVLVKDRQTLEQTTRADVMVIDKTGTLTTGVFDILEIKSFSKYSKDEILALMAGLEVGSSHPIATSILKNAADHNIHAENFENIKTQSGIGLSGQLNGKTYRLVSLATYEEDLAFDYSEGSTVSVLIEDNQLIGAIALGDSLKDSSKEFIKALKEQGIRPIMATGDNEAAARAVADQLDIDYYANQSPEDKYQLVEKLKHAGHTVIMVGDGINDAPSLTLADVGIAIGAGTQVAIDSSDVILTRSEPGDLKSFIDLAHQTNKKMKQNLVWGAGYNFVAIPLAAGILAPIGIILTPAVGAILMSLSTVIVAINAMSLNLKD